MRNWFLISMMLIGFVVNAQVDSSAPYKRFPTLPPLEILLGDSTTKYTKNQVPKDKPVLLMLFSPDCHHCQQTAEEMNAHKTELQNIQIVLATLHPLWQMNDFVKKYALDQHQNVVIGKDIYYILPSWYNIKHLPYMAMYNKKGSLISVFEGGLSIPKVLQIFKDNH